MYRYLNGKWGDYSMEQIVEATPEEDRPFINSFGQVDRPQILSDKDDLVEQLADSIRPYHNALSYSIAVLDDGIRKIYCRPRNPCLGNLTKYEVDYPDEGEFNKKKPGDLHYIFPKGHPIGISLYINKFTELSKALIEDSPVSEALYGSRVFSHHEIPDRHILVQPNMVIDPNVFWMGVKYLKTVNENNSKMFSELKEKVGSHTAIALLAWTGSFSYAQWASYERLVTNNPHRISKGKYSEGYGYTRSNCEYIFSSKDLKFGTSVFYNNPSEEKTIDGHLCFLEVVKTLKLTAKNGDFRTIDNLLKCEQFLRTELEKKEGFHD